MKKTNKHNYDLKNKSKFFMFLSNRKFIFSFIAILFIIFLTLFFFINKENGNDEKTINITNNTQQNINYSQTKPNEAGDILVIMYHSIDNSKDHYPWHRSVKEFKNDLLYMYKNNYVLISMKEYLSGDINIPKGKTPIVLTFDDGLKSCFSLVKNKEGKLVLNKNTLIGILEEFKSEHPDFGSGGVLYITNNPFDNDAFCNVTSLGSYEDKFRILTLLGYEIGNHTYNHYNISTLSTKQINSEIGKVNNLVYKNTDNTKTVHLAYPYGDKPSKKALKAIKSGTYKDISYNMESAVLAAPESPYFTNPLNKDFNRYYISRTIANKGSDRDMYWYFNYYKKHPKEKYISDGDNTVLSVPLSYKNKLDNDKIKGYNVVYYDENTFEKIN